MNFVYQDWDMLRDTSREIEKQEKRPVQTITPIRTYQQLQEARIRKRFTVMDVAEAIGISTEAVSFYENGTEAPNEEIRRKLFDFLGIE